MARHWWAAYARTRGEFAAQEALQAIGIDARVARQVEAYRPPTKRTAVPVTRPYLSRVVFIHVTDDEWHQAVALKEVPGSLMAINDKSAERFLLPFLARVEADYQERMAAIEAGQRVEEYAPGDLLEILAGPLAGTIATFRQVMHRAHETHPLIQAEGEMFGGKVALELDPVQVRKKVG
jgi:transcription antitermination factor NusG